MTKFNQAQVDVWAYTVVCINKTAQDNGFGKEQKEVLAGLVLQSNPFDMETMVNITMNTSYPESTVEDIIQLIELSIEGVPNGFI